MTTGALVGVRVEWPAVPRRRSFLLVLAWLPCLSCAAAWALSYHRADRWCWKTASVENQVGAAYVLMYARWEDLQGHSFGAGRGRGMGVRDGP
jgi:hypothetical protein